MTRLLPCLERRLSTLLAAGALLALAGCGGSGGNLLGVFGDSPCVSCFASTVVVTGSASTVQVGSSVTFTALLSTTSIYAPAYQWRRSAAGSAAFVNIPGATGLTYTLPAATLADDQATFQIVVTGDPSGQLVSGQTLHVSSMPPVLLQDGTFAGADWAAIGLATGTGAQDVQEQVASGGNPGAFRRHTTTLPAGTSGLTEISLYQPAGYDPAVQGPLDHLDYAEDCSYLGITAFAVTPNVALAQGGRVFLASIVFRCAPAFGWLNQGKVLIHAGDFAIASGPACPQSATCPDFSASGAPMQFGYARTAQATGASAPLTTMHGIDNWQVTLWRR